MFHEKPGNCAQNNELTFKDINRKNDDKQDEENENTSSGENEENTIRQENEEDTIIKESKDDTTLEETDKEYETSTETSFDEKKGIRASSKRPRDRFTLKKPDYFGNYMMAIEEFLLAQESPEIRSSISCQRIRPTSRNRLRSNLQSSCKNGDNSFGSQYCSQRRNASGSIRCLNSVPLR